MKNIDKLIALSKAHYELTQKRIDIPLSLIQYYEGKKISQDTIASIIALDKTILEEDQWDHAALVLCKHLTLRSNRYKAFGDRIKDWSVYCYRDREQRFHSIVKDDIEVFLAPYTPSHASDHSKEKHTLYVGNQILRIEGISSCHDRTPFFTEIYQDNEAKSPKVHAEKIGPPELHEYPKLNSITQDTHSSHHTAKNCIKALTLMFYYHLNTTENLEILAYLKEKSRVSEKLIELLDPNNQYFKHFQFNREGLSLIIKEDKNPCRIHFTKTIQQFSSPLKFIQWIFLDAKCSSELELLIHIQTCLFSDGLNHELPISCLARTKNFDLRVYRSLSVIPEIPIHLFDLTSHSSLKPFWIEAPAHLLKKLFDHHTKQSTSSFPEALIPLLTKLTYFNRKHLVVLQYWFNRLNSTSLTKLFYSTLINSIEIDFVAELLTINSRKNLTLAINHDPNIQKQLEDSHLSHDHDNAVTNHITPPQSMPAPKTRRKKNKPQLKSLQDIKKYFTEKVMKKVHISMKSLQKNNGGTIIPLRKILFDLSLPENWKIDFDNILPSAENFTDFIYILTFPSKIDPTAQNHSGDVLARYTFDADFEDTRSLLHYVNCRTLSLLLKIASPFTSQQGTNSDIIFILIYRSFLSALIDFDETPNSIKRLRTYFKSPFQINRTTLSKKPLLIDYIFSTKRRVNLNHVKSLIKMGADVNSTHQEHINGITITYYPIVISVLIAHFDLFILLTNNGASLNIDNIYEDPNIDLSTMSSSKKAFVLRDLNPEKAHKTTNLMEIALGEWGVLSDEYLISEINKIIYFLYNHTFWEVSKYRPIDISNFRSNHRKGNPALKDIPSPKLDVTQLENLSPLERNKTIIQHRDRIFHHSRPGILFLGYEFAAQAILSNCPKTLVNLIEFFKLDVNRIYCLNEIHEAVITTEIGSTQDELEKLLSFEYIHKSLLHISIELQRTQIMLILLEYGAKFESLDENGESCYDYALKHNVAIPEWIPPYQPNLTLIQKFKLRVAEYSLWSQEYLYLLLQPMNILQQLSADCSFLEHIPETTDSEDLQTVIKNLQSIRKLKACNPAPEIQGLFTALIAKTVELKKKQTKKSTPKPTSADKRSSDNQRGHALSLFASTQGSSATARDPSNLHTAIKDSCSDPIMRK